MKIIVTKYLNVRVGAPSVNAPCYNYLAPGSTIEVEENTVPGDLYADNDRWYKGVDGSYYWSGGVALTTGPDTVVKSANAPVDYNALFKNIPAALRETKGKDVKIAVLDTGIFLKHPDLSSAFSAAYPAVNLSDSNVAEDINGHGTHIAGLMAARGVNANGVTGIASASTLHSIKVLRDDLTSVGAFVSKGLNSILPGTDIINMSLGVTVKDYKQLIAPQIDNLAKTTIIICAAGEDDQLLNDPRTMPAPAYSESVIAVGAISSNFIKKYGNAPVFHPQLDYIIPDISLRSASTNANNLYKDLHGSSMSAALVSGLAALIVSANKAHTPINKAFIKSQLDAMAIKYNSGLDLNSLYLIKP